MSFDLTAKQRNEGDPDPALMLLSRWDIGGHSEVDDDRVRLTRNKQGQRGWLWLHDPPSDRAFAGRWRIDLQMRIGGTSAAYFGDGMALWLVQGRPRNGNNFGHSTEYRGLGVFFDTFDNSGGRQSARKYPSVSMAFSDGKHFNAPFDRNAADGGSSLPSGSECSARIRQFGSGGKYVTARLTHEPLKPRARASQAAAQAAGKGEGEGPLYVGGELQLKLYFSQRPGPDALPSDPDSSQGWVHCARARVTAADLRAAQAQARGGGRRAVPSGGGDGMTPMGPLVGLSASTGDLTDQHDALWLSFFAEKGVAGAIESGEWGGVRTGASSSSGLSQEGEDGGEAVGGEGEGEGGGKAGAEAGGSVSMSAEEIEEVLRSAGVVQFLQRQAEEDRAQVRGLRKELEAKVASVGRHFDETMERLQKAEEALGGRLERVQAHVKEQAQRAHEEAKGLGTRWAARSVVAMLFAGALLAAGCATARMCPPPLPSGASGSGGGAKGRGRARSGVSSRPGSTGFR